MASSLALRSVKSRVTFAKPRSSPSPSRSAVTTTFAQKRVPSFLTLQDSCSVRPSAAARASSAAGLPAATSSGGKSSATSLPRISSDV